LISFAEHQNLLFFMRKFTKQPASGFIHNLRLNAETFRKQERKGKTVSGTDKKCFHCNPSDQLKMEAPTGDIERLVAQMPAGGENAGSGQKDAKPAETSKFILDYIPLCCEEDLELIAYYFGKDKEEQSS
jgi:hypothetical protein